MVKDLEKRISALERKMDMTTRVLDVFGTRILTSGEKEVYRTCLKLLKTIKDKDIGKT